MRIASMTSRALSLLALTALPVGLMALVLPLGLAEGYLGIDFLPLRTAARDIAAGRSPWPTPEELPRLLDEGIAFVYPPVAAFVAAPFAVLPETAAILAWSALLIGATLLALRLLGVRDPRCYGAAFLWGCVVSAIQTGNVTLLLVLGLAGLWRARNRPVAAALITGVLIALKPFLWPLVVWLFGRRRPSVAIGALGVVTAVTVASWAFLGFEGLAAYPELLRALHRIEESQSYSVLAFALDAGVARGGALAAHLLAGGCLLAFCAVLGRRRYDASAFGLAIGSAIALSSVVWLHYFALLLVPVAILRPRFGPVWLVPLLFWLGTGTGNGAPWQTALVLAVAAATVGVALRRRAAPRAEAVADPIAARAAA